MLYPKKTLGDLKGIVLKAVGREDSVTSTLAKEAINWSALLVASVYKPTELMTKANLTLGANVSTLDLNNLTRWLKVRSVYNSTASSPLYPIDYELWDHVIPANQGLKFYTIFGSVMYFNEAPSNEQTLEISHHQYPAVLSDDADELSFGGYDSVICSVASGVVFACLEEGESADIMKNVAEYFNVPLQLSAREKELLEGYEFALKKEVAKQ